MSQPEPELRRLARLYGVQPEYYDIGGQVRRAGEGALLDVLRALGAAVESAGDVASAVRARRSELWRRGLPPTLVAWDGRLAPFKLRRPRAMKLDAARVELEDGTSAALDLHAESCGERLIGTEAYRVERLRTTQRLPPGYHRLRLSSQDGGGWQALVIAAPLRAWSPGEADGADEGSRAGEQGAAAAGGHSVERRWCAFLPLYALRTERGWPTGDLTDLEALLGWVGEQGGALLGTLPLLATFLGKPFLEPSPYSPASRLFWNELFVDVTAAPELEHCPPAQALLASSSLQDALARLREDPYVDYAQEYELKRRILELLAGCFFEAGGAEDRGFGDFLRLVPESRRYARFRAACDRSAQPWPCWAEPMAGGRLEAGDYDEAAYRTHLYAQYLLHGQLTRLLAGAAEGRARLYLDLPLGVHPDSYDVWAHRELFALGVSAGAPPDPFIASGQSWGFPPMRPTAMRENGYAYTIASIRNHLRYAGALRLDHVMALHRLFWVPNQRPALEGVYVRYHPEELYAILTLESRRARALIIGEDLGTVPPAVRTAMARHGIRRMYIAQFEFTGDPGRAVGDVPPHAIAGINTHDMPPFAAFWDGRDIEERRELGWLDSGAATAEREQRRRQREALIAYLYRVGLLDGEATTERVLRALLAYLGRSGAELLLVNLEDLWLEQRPHNIPGTWRERPNWRRRAALRFEEFRDAPEVTETLARLRPRLPTAPGSWDRSRA